MAIRLILAPLRGITTADFRGIYAGHFPGFDAAVAPFIPTTHGRKVSVSHLRDVLPENNRDLPVIPQLLGRNPDDFVQMAAVLTDMGYSTINWNLGCPMPTVTGKRRGAGLLPFTDEIERFLDHVMARVRCGISIKARIGFDDPDQLPNLIPRINKYPIEELIIHPRTARQMYTGELDLDRYGRCSRSSTIPQGYSGDITDTTILASLQARFPETSSWLLGRGVLANPFLPGSIRGIAPPDDPLDRLQAFHGDLYATYSEKLHGPAVILGRMKELWFYLSRSFAGGEQLLKTIKKTRSLSAYEETMRNLFGGVGTHAIVPGTGGKGAGARIGRECGRSGSVQPILGTH